MVAMDLKAQDISLKRRNCSVNSDYSIILVDSQIPLPSITPCCSSEEHHFYLYTT